MSNYNAREKLSNNIEALRIIFNWDGLDPLPESELEVLRNYSGFGALKAILYKTEEDWTGASEADKKLRPLYDELYDLLESNLNVKEYKRVIESVRNSTLSAFYTPRVVPDTLFKVLSRYMKIESLYEPSAGVGVYIESALDNLPGVKRIIGYEKDLLTAKVLQVLASHCREDVRVNIHPQPLEESSNLEKDIADIVCSNIPFGAVPVYDENISDRNLTGKLHNYFFAKGIEKIKDGGVLAYLTTDAFLNSPSNKSARRYLFTHTDFLSCVCMPDNLYKETAGTEAPSHLVVVRKNTDKKQLSGEEELLCESSVQEYMGIKVAMNHWVMQTDYSPYIGVPEPGKNQYGKPALEVRWLSPIENIAQSLEQILVRDLDQRWIKDTDQLERELADKDILQELRSSPFGKEHIIVGSIPKQEENDEWEDGKKADAVKMPGGKFYPNRPITLSDIPDKVKMFMPRHQQQIIVGSEEHWDIIRNLKNIIEQIPGPYGQDGVPAYDKIVYLHYFYGNCDWYITERDEWGIQYQMFGYANLGDDEMAEWGYVGVPELEGSRVELDLFWKPCRFCDIGKDNYESVVDKVLSETPSLPDGVTYSSVLKEWREKITLPDTCSVEPVKGTIIQVEGKLVQIEQVNSDNTVTVVEPDIKAGKEADVMSAYLAIRDTFVELEKEQEKW